MLLRTVVTGAGAGLPVVLLHGLFGQARNLGRLQRRLPQDGPVVAVDLRSHGTSPAGRLDLRAMAGDVVETLAALGMARAAVVGHSLGGKVGMAMALGHPGAVERLLVADIAPRAYAHGNERFARALQALPLTPGLTRAAADAALARSVEDPSVRGLLLQNLETGASPHWRFGLAEIAGSIGEAEGWPEWPAGARYDGPALFVRGGRSDYLPDAAWPGVVTLFPAAELVTVAEAGHWLHVEQPDEFAAIVAAFVRPSQHSA